MTDVKKEGILLSGTYLEFGVTDLVAGNPVALESAGHFIFNLFLRKKD